MLVLLLAGDYLGAKRSALMALDDVKRLRFRFAIAQIQNHLALCEIGFGNFAASSRFARLVEAEGRQHGDAFLLTLAATTRMRLLVAQGLAAEAARAPLPPLTKTRSAAGEFFAIRALAFAAAEDDAGALLLAERAVATTKSIEAQVVAEGARAAVRRTREAAVGLVQATRETGNIDGCLTVLRGSHVVRHAVQSLAQERGDVGLFCRMLLARVDVHVPRTRMRAALTPREREVLGLLRQGLSNKQIGAALYISDVTVKVHLRHIYEKLGVRSRVAAALIAQDMEA